MTLVINPVVGTYSCSNAIIIHEKTPSEFKPRVKADFWNQEKKVVLQYSVPDHPKSSRLLIIFCTMAYYLCKFHAMSTHDFVSNSTDKPLKPNKQSLV